MAGIRARPGGLAQRTLATRAAENARGACGGRRTQRDTVLETLDSGVVCRAGQPVPLVERVRLRGAALSDPVHSAREREKTHLEIVLFGVLLEDACRLLDIADCACPVDRGVPGEQNGADGAQPPRELFDLKDVAVQAHVQDRL